MLTAGIMGARKRHCRFMIRPFSSRERSKLAENLKTTFRLGLLSFLAIVASVYPGHPINAAEMMRAVCGISHLVLQKVVQMCHQMKAFEGRCAT